MKSDFEGGAAKRSQWAKSACQSNVGRSRRHVETRRDDDIYDIDRCTAGNLHDPTGGGATSVVMVTVDTGDSPDFVETPIGDMGDGQDQLARTGFSAIGQLTIGGLLTRWAFCSRSFAVGVLGNSPRRSRSFQALA